MQSSVCSPVPGRNKSSKNLLGEMLLDENPSLKGVASASDMACLASVAQTFKSFNRLALRLQTSQLKLRQQLVSLESELVSVDEQRLRELSAKEQLAERLEQLLHAMPSGVIELDAMGCIQLANQAAQTILEHPLVGHSWRDIIDDIFAPQPDDGHEISLTNGKRVSLATESLQVGQILLITDLTETRKLQNELAQHTRLVTLGEMSATLAHQIRTPLATAQLYVSELPRHLQDPPKLAQYLDKITVKLSLLNQQVEDMLLFARREWVLEDRVLLSQVLNDAIDSVTAQAQAHQVTIQCEFAAPDFNINCHYAGFVGALTNLLVNAIEASQPEDTIFFKSAQRCVEGEIRYLIQVLDQGVGIDGISDIFKPFITTKYTGTGLGMNVVKWMMDVHQCSINVISHPKQGTCITLEFTQESVLLKSMKGRD